MTQGCANLLRLHSRELKIIVLIQPELDQDIEAGQKAADTVCQYADWLLSTVNPNPPDENMWVRPQKFIHVKEVMKTSQKMRNNQIM